MDLADRSRMKVPYKSASIAHTQPRQSAVSWCNPSLLTQLLTQKGSILLANESENKTEILPVIVYSIKYRGNLPVTCSRHFQLEPQDPKENII